MSTSKTKRKIKRRLKRLQKKRGSSAISGPSSSGASASRPQSNAQANAQSNARSRQTAASTAGRSRSKAVTNRPAPSTTPRPAPPAAPVNTVLSPSSVKRASVQDFNSGRTLFATQRADGKREYLPKRSEASDSELARGKFVPDDAVEVPAIGNPILRKRPVFDFNGQRTLYATQGANNKTDYLPRKSNATAAELSTGRYINDSEVTPKAALGAAGAMRDQAPRYDLGKGRTVYAVQTAQNQTRYLPRESDATAYERSQGLYIPDDIVDQHESQRRRTALNSNSAQQNSRRAQRTNRLPGQSSRSTQSRRPVTQDKNGTPLWDGFTPPTVSEQKRQTTLRTLKPRYDIGKGRKIYPTETGPGKIEYLPLAADATRYEYNRGFYAAFVPQESLEDFLAHERNNGTLSRQPFETDSGPITAYAQADIERALEQAPALVLRSARFVSDRARDIPSLQQKSA